MKKIIYLLLILGSVVFFACNGKTKEPEKTAEEQADDVMDDIMKDLPEQNMPDSSINQTGQDQSPQK